MESVGKNGPSDPTSETKTIVLSPLKLALQLRELTRNPSSHEFLIRKYDILKGLAKLIYVDDDRVQIASLQALELLARNPINRKSIRKEEDLMKTIETCAVANGSENNNSIQLDKKIVSLGNKNPSEVIDTLKSNIVTLLAKKTWKSKKKKSSTKIRTKVDVEFSYLESEEDAEEIRSEVLKISGVISVTCDLEKQVITCYCRKGRDEMMGKLKKAMNAVINARRSRASSSISTNSDAYNYVPEMREGKNNAAHQRTSSTIGVYESPETTFDKEKHQEKRKRAMERRRQAKSGYLGMLSYFF
eukprot:jgi/Bigna1/143195/aug1.76_g17903